MGGATVDELSDYDGLRAAIRDAGFDIAQESVGDGGTDTLGFALFVLRA